MTDFLTGASGCLGRSVLKTLLARNRRVICAVRSPEILRLDPLFTTSAVELVECDFGKSDWTESVIRSVEKCENVFHVAAEMPHRTTCRASRSVLRRVNVDATRELYGLAKNSSRFLFVSSIAIYGDSFATERAEDGSRRPGDYYAISKIEAEAALFRENRKGGPGLYIVRPGLIYGDRDTNAVQKIIELTDKGRFRVLGDGSNVRTLSAAPLVAETLSRLSESDASGPVILNVVDPKPPTLRRFADDIADLLGAPSPSSLPPSLVYPAAAVFSMLNFVGVRTRFKISDVRKMTTSNPIQSQGLKRLFGMVPDYYRETLAEDVAWYRSRCSGKRRG